MARMIDAEALKEMIDFRMWDVDDDYPHDEASIRIGEDHAVKKIIDDMPTIERDVPKRVLWTGWKGHRDTRYKCPSCKKTVRNDDVYCHKCGQRLMFPKIDFTPYVEGQKQELIVRWDDEAD